MKNKALFLDRDGVVNKLIKKHSNFYNKVIDDSPFKLKELKFNKGIEYLINTARKKGYMVIIITNQPSIVKGDCSMKDYEEITTKICNNLGLKRSNVFECFHRPPLTLECSCRKPKPGLLFMAKGLHNLDLEKSILVGDSSSDIQAANKAKIKKTFYLRRKKSEDQIGNYNDEKIMKEKNIFPTKICNNLIEIIKEL